MKLRIGDVFHLPVTNGSAYLQATHLDRSPISLGWYCRVLPSLRKAIEHQHELNELLDTREQFGCFVFDLTTLKRIGTFKVPAHAERFPVFKQFGGLIPSAEGIWSFWDGKVERVAPKLPRDTVDFPIRETVDTSVVRDRVDTKWTPKNDVPKECVTKSDRPFAFEDYPLVSEFWDRPEKYGDMIGFLRHHGLIKENDVDTGVDITGNGPFENSVAVEWFGNLRRSFGWKGVALLLQRFVNSQRCDAVPTAVALAAVGTVLLSKAPKRFAVDSTIVVSWGRVPLDVLRFSGVAVTAATTRSGLREAFKQLGKLKPWLKYWEKIELQIIDFQTQEEQ